MHLRPHQRDDVERIRIALPRSGSAVYVLGTGGGKTVVAAEVAKRVVDNGHVVLFLVHRRELVRQTLATLREACPELTIGVEAPGWPSIPWAPLQVGMIQSIRRRTLMFVPKLVIGDEFHHVKADTYEEVLARWPDAQLLGLTATPERLDGQGLRPPFVEMVQGPTMPELVADGYLAPTRTLRPVVETGHAIADPVAAYLRYTPGQRALFFGRHTQHSIEVCEGLRAAGYRAAHVDGTDSTARRDRIMREFLTGGLDVVGNCDLVSEGFDAPACEVVIMGRQTKSVTRYLQMAGRAMRPGEDKVATVLDCAGISHHLGLPDEVREWSLDAGEVVAPQGRERSPRACDKCWTVFYGPKCPGCQYVAPLSEVLSIEMILQQAGITRRAGTKLNRKDAQKVVLKIRGMPDRSARLKVLASAQGYPPGWTGQIERLWEMT